MLLPLPMNQMSEYPEYLLPHADFGDEKCPGVFIPLERSNQVDIACDQCGC